MDLENEKKRWEESSLKPILQKYPERKKHFLTSSDIPLPVLATPNEIDYLEDRKSVV